MKVVILAGGSGSRLFPLSRHDKPKQFLAIGGEESLLQQTIKRFFGLVNAEDIVIVTNKKYADYVQSDLRECQAEKAHVIFEPTAKNTAPAVALALMYCRDKLRAEGDETVLVAPSDHLMKPKAEFQKAVKKAFSFAAEGKIVTFGVQPTRADTGFGYIEIGDDLGGAFVTNSFKEKPNEKTAKDYLAAGNFLWNSGMFAFRIDCYFYELKKYTPDIVSRMGKNYEYTLQMFADMPSISIDYAVAEKSDKVVTIPLNFYWNDVGSWDAVYEFLAKDENDNALSGEGKLIDCKNNLFVGNKRVFAAIGLRDILVVDTDDVILIARRGESQRVREVTD